MPANISRGEDASPATLSFPDALVQALGNNPRLLALEQRYEAAVQRIPQAAALPDPKLQVTHFLESVQTRTGPQENIIALSQGLPWPGTLRERENRASAEAEVIWHGYRAAQLQFVREVGESYFEYAYLELAVGIMDENLRLLEELLPVVEEKVSAGGDLSSLLRLKLEVGRVEDRRNGLDKARQVVAARLQELLAWIGEIPPLDWGIPELRNWDADALHQAMASTHPELRVAALKGESAEAAAALARLLARPNLSLGINYIQLGDAAGSGVAGSGQDPWGVTFSMTLPVQFKKNRAARAEASAMVKASDAEAMETGNRLDRQLRASLAQYEDARRRYRLYSDDLIPLAQQAWEISQTSYQGGQTGILEVIDSERALLQLRLEYWRAVADVWQLTINIQALTNTSAFGNLYEIE